MIRALLKISLLILFLSQYSSLIKAQENILEADKIEYINKDGKVFAKGSVLIIREGYKLEADEVTFDPSKNIIEAVGKIRIEESNGNIITASRIKLSADLSDGLIELPRITTKDGTSLSSAYAIRSNNNATILRKGIFSPCKACKNENKRISWQVKANRIIHDEENGNIIYEGARFELFGVPIFYVPIAAHPSPEVKRRSGLLAPSLTSSGDLGVVLKTPYFINLAQNYDLTITPWLVTKGALIVEGEWRQKFKKGEINFYGIGASLSDSFKSKTVNVHNDWLSVINSPFNSDEELSKLGKKLAYTYDDNNHSISNVEVANIDDGRPSSISDAIGYDFRGSLSTYGKFILNDWDINFNGTFVSDDTFLRRFDLSDNTSLISKLSFSKNWSTMKILVEATHFSLLLPEENGSEPLILPSINFNWSPKTKILGGDIELDLNFLNIYRRTDGNTQRLSLNGIWNKKYIFESGSLLKFKVDLRGDMYRTTKRWIPNNSSRLLPSNPFGKEISIARFLPTISAEWSMPLLSTKSSTIIEPIINVSLATNDREYTKIPNEDGLAFELNSTNIFLSNRIQGYDRWESGNRINYGFRLSHYWGESSAITAMVGQSYRFSDLQFAEKGNGIEKHLSDLVFDLLYKPNMNIAISYRGRVEEKDFNLIRSEFDIQGNFKNWGFRAGHAHFDNEESYQFTEQKEVRLASFININNNWFIQGAIRYDIELKNSLRNRLSIVYVDECISFELGFRRKFAKYRDLEPSNSFMIKLNVFTFGGGTIDSSERLRKLWERVE